MKTLNPPKVKVQIKKQKEKSRFNALRGIAVVKKADNHKGCLQKTTYKAHDKRARVAPLHCPILAVACKV